MEIIEFIQILVGNLFIIIGTFVACVIIFKMLDKISRQ